MASRKQFKFRQINRRKLALGAMEARPGQYPNFQRDKQRLKENIAHLEAGHSLSTVPVTRAEDKKKDGKAKEAA